MGVYTSCKVKVPYKIFYKALENWELYFTERNTDYSSSFFGCDLDALKFVDCTRQSVGVPNEQVAQRINMLAGPYWKTILKAWELKNDRKRD